MLLFNSHVTSFLLLSLLVTRSFTSASPTYSAYYCPKNATYQSSTAFQNNLNLLISSLTSNASEGHDGAYQTNIGLWAADVASGLFLWRGDVSYASCAACVATAAEDISRRCRNQTQSIIWYDQCMLGYTNRFFNPVSIVPRVNLWDGNNVSNSDFDSFNRTLFSLLDSLAEEASSSQSGKKFATDERNYGGSSGHTTLYGLAQCAPSLRNAQCEECLKNGIGTILTCCGGKQGARALLAWCYIRYKSYKYYNTSGTSASPLLPPTPSGEKESGSKPVVLIVVIVGVLATLICLLGYFLLGRAARKTYNTLLREILAYFDVAPVGDESATLESLQFSLGTIEAATNKFSYENKIGNGGFGEVYKVIKAFFQMEGK